MKTHSALCKCESCSLHRSILKGTTRIQIIAGFDQCEICNEEVRDCKEIEGCLVCPDCVPELESDEPTCENCGAQINEHTATTVDTVDGNQSMCADCAEEFGTEE